MLIIIISLHAARFPDSESVNFRPIIELDPYYTRNTLIVDPFCIFTHGLVVL